MVGVRRSAPKSKKGCQTCKIRRVKCDESQPQCHRCTSTGRACDGYSKESAPTSPTNLVLLQSSIVSAARTVSVADDAQERRSFDFFRNETAPNIAGFFGSSTWNLVLQACTREPAIGQAVIALGALHETSLTPFPSSGANSQRAIQTSFPQRQYSNALGGLRNYLSKPIGLDLNVVLICALIHISIEVIRNNYVNAVMHLENSLKLLQQPSRLTPEALPDQASQHSRLMNVDVDIELSRAFFRLDLQASAYLGRRAPVLAEERAAQTILARFSSIHQAKDVLDSLTGRLYSLIRNTIEPYRYIKDENIPNEAIAEVAHLKQMLDLWGEHFEKYLRRSTSRFSRQEQLVINVLLINHKMSSTQAATCTHRAASIFDHLDTQFDEIVTLAATVIWARNTPLPMAVSPTLNFSLDSDIIHPLYWTAIKCLEPWIRQRAMSLLRRCIGFQEGVWDAAAQVRIAEVVIEREQHQCFTGSGSAVGVGQRRRPPEWARVHSVGTNVLDPVRRVAEVSLSQRLDGLEGPWTDYTEWISW